MLFTNISAAALAEDYAAKKKKLTESFLSKIAELRIDLANKVHAYKESISELEAEVVVKSKEIENLDELTKEIK